MGNATGVAGKIAGSSCKKTLTGNVVEATEKYQVLGALSATSLTIMGAAGLPAIGTVHPVYTSLYVIGLEPEQGEDGARWVVTVRYGRNPAGGTGYNASMTVYGSWESSEDLIADAETGAAVLNSADDPFEATISVPRKYPMWTIQKHVATLNIATVMAQNGTVNATSVTMPCGTTIAARCGYLDCEVTDTPGGGYDLRLVVRKRQHLVILDGGETATDIGWDEAFMQQGYFFKVDGVGNKLRIMETEMGVDMTPRLDETGQPILRPAGKPMLLADDGNLLSSGSPLFKRVATIPSTNWSVL